MLQAFKDFARKSAEKKLDKTIKKQLERLAKLIGTGQRNEEETRRWVIDVLKDGLGYRDSDMETESKMLGKRADITLRNAGRIFMVIECKAATFKLNRAATNQVTAYAISVGAEWAVVTNGQRWRLFHVSPTQGVTPDVVEIFDIALLDEDGVSSDDLYFLSLLRAESINVGETREAYHNINSMSYRRIKEEFLHPEVIKHIARRMEDRYLKNMGVAVNILPEDLYEYVGCVFDAYIKLEEEL